MHKTLATITQALKTDYNLEFNVTYCPSANVFRGCCGVWVDDATIFQEEITVQCSNIGGVLEQLAREMLEKYLSNEISTENNNVLPNDRS